MKAVLEQIRRVPAPYAQPPARNKAGRKVAYRGEGELWDLRDKYLGWMRSTGFSNVTMKGVHSDLLLFIRHLEGIGVNRIADVTSEVIEGYAFALRRLKNGLKPSALTISHRLNTIIQLFRWLNDQGLILCDPTEGIEMPKVPFERPHTILTQEEAKRLVEIPPLNNPVGYRDRALLELLYSSGIRSAELMKLKVNDLDFESNLISVKQGKWRKDRLIPVPPHCLAYVKEYIDKIRPRFARFRKKDDGVLFLNWTGCNLDINRLCEIIRRNAKEAGISKHVTAMTLRHSIISHLLENGMGMRQLQEFAGHERLETTQIYASVTLPGLRKQFRLHHPKERRALVIPDAPKVAGE